MAICYFEVAHTSFTAEVIFINNNNYLSYTCTHILHRHGGPGNVDDVFIDPDWIFEGFPHELIEKTLLGNLAAAALTVNEDGHITNFSIRIHAHNKGKRMELPNLFRNNRISLNIAFFLSDIHPKPILVQPSAEQFFKAAFLLRGHNKFICHNLVAFREYKGKRLLFRQVGLELKLSAGSGSVCAFNVFEVNETKKSDKENNMSIEKIR